MPAMFFVSREDILEFLHAVADDKICVVCYTCYFEEFLDESLVFTLVATWTSKRKLSL